jgi:BolA protein
MNINELIAIIKAKLENNFQIQNIKIEDKSFLHKNHKSNEKGKFHLKISIESKELNKIGKLESNRIIHKIMNEEIKLYIHSLQILIH